MREAVRKLLSTIDGYGDILMCVFDRSCLLVFVHTTLPLVSPAIMLPQIVLDRYLVFCRRATVVKEAPESYTEVAFCETVVLSQANLREVVSPYFTEV